MSSLKRKEINDGGAKSVFLGNQNKSTLSVIKTAVCVRAHVYIILQHTKFSLFSAAPKAQPVHVIRVVSPSLCVLRAPTREPITFSRVGAAAIYLDVLYDSDDDECDDLSECSRWPWRSKCGSASFIFL